MNFLGDERQSNSHETYAKNYQNQMYYSGTFANTYGKHKCIK